MVTHFKQGVKDWWFAMGVEHRQTMVLIVAAAILKFVMIMALVWSFITLFDRIVILVVQP